MKPIGKILALLWVLALALPSINSQAALTASVDRNRVSLGDTLRLTITATDGENVANLDLAPLAVDFEILQRSSSSNTRIVNGNRSDTRQLMVEMTPRREGTLQIPPLRVGQATTNALQLVADPPPRGSPGNDGTGTQNMGFEAELDQDSVYVQGQAILTLRVYQGINLEDLSITELKLDNAFVQPLEQNSFQRTIDGRRWMVHEVRYAIFPEQSGTLEIPAQVFSGREASPRRSLFDLGGGGRMLRRSSEPLSLSVLPRPDSYPDATWLPARNLSIEETWSTPPEQLRAGESATRTIRIRAQGLQGAQLPPVLFPPSDGLKYYPDQPVISDTENELGLAGSRVDSAALVPTRAGSWHIPEIRIPWWDTSSGELRYAVLPARDITVAAGDPLTHMTPPAPESIATVAAEPPDALSQGTPILVQQNPWQWQLLSAAMGIGWLATLLYLFYSRRRQTTNPAAPAATGNPAEKPAFQALQKACAANNPTTARKALVDWAAALSGDKTLVSLSQAAALFNDPGLNTQVQSLNAALYADAGTSWDGAALAGALKQLRAQRQSAGNGLHGRLELYPRAA